MPSIADIYSYIDSLKRRGSDFIQNPGTSLQQMVGYANDRAGAYNQALSESAREPLTSPKTQALASQMAEGYSPVGMTVYHGSPYKFKVFDPAKIGTGEGAQAYGHGLYVAENPKVATDYMKIEPAGAVASPRRTLFGSEVETGTPEYKVAQLVDEMGLSKARKFILDWSKNPNPDQVEFVGKASDVIQKLTKKGDAKNLGTGNMYKIDLPDEHIAKMLDWDKPLSEQHPDVQKAIKKTKELLPPNAMDDLGGDLSLLYGKDITPKDFLNTWESLTGSVGSGEAALAKHGIPGVKYLDEQSRGAGEGTRNFVIFPGNEHLLDIQDINGNPLNN